MQGSTEKYRLEREAYFETPEEYRYERTRLWNYGYEGDDIVNPDVLTVNVG